MANCRAFVLEPSKYSVRSVLELANDLVYLYPNEGDRTSLYDDAIIEDIQNLLEEYDFDPLSDYIVATGDVAAIVVLLSSVCIAYDSVRILVWDSKESKYAKLDIKHYETER